MLHRGPALFALLLVGVFFAPVPLVAQPFVKRLLILHNDLPIEVLHASASRGFPPLHHHCLCLRIPADVQGQVIVELKDACKVGFGNFHGYATQGLLYACFTMRELEIHNSRLHFSGKPIDQMILRRPYDGKPR